MTLTSNVERLTLPLERVEIFKTFTPFKIFRSIRRKKGRIKREGKKAKKKKQTLISTSPPFFKVRLTKLDSCVTIIGTVNS